MRPSIGQTVEWFHAGQTCSGRITTCCGPAADEDYTLTVIEISSGHMVTLRSPAAFAPTRLNREVARYEMHLYSPLH